MISTIHFYVKMNPIYLTGVYMYILNIVVSSSSVGMVSPTGIQNLSASQCFEIRCKIREKQHAVF